MSGVLPYTLRLICGLLLLHMPVMAHVVVIQSLYYFLSYDWMFSIIYVLFSVINNNFELFFHAEP